jgi:protein-tyrosine phosphatase
VETGVSGYSYLTADKRLAQGAKPPVGVRLPFEVIVLAAYECQYDLPGFEVIQVPLDDDFEQPVTLEDRTRIHATARAVARHVRAGRRVLVTCHHGRNRSGVIAGLALVELGVPGAEAFKRIRHLRDGLTNPHFRRMVIGS